MYYIFHTSRRFNRFALVTGLAQLCLRSCTKFTDCGSLGSITVSADSIHEMLHPWSVTQFFQISKNIICFFILHHKKQQRQQTHLTHRFCKPENDDDDDDQILAATELQVAGELRDLAAVLAELKKTKTTNSAERYATRLGQIARGY